MLKKTLFLLNLGLFLFFVNTDLFAQNSSLDSLRERFERYISSHPFSLRPHLNKKEIKAIPKKDRPDLAMEHNFLMTFDPALGFVPKERASIAYNITKQLLAAKSAVFGVNWQERGPNNVGGRTRALMFDPNDVTHKKVWAGGVAGGLWFNNDITNANSSWQNVNDFWANIVISCIASDPSNSQVFYVGTGEGYFNADAIRGDGIWKTIDGGATWTQLASTIPGVSPSLTDFPYVTKIVVNSIGTVFAATRGEYSNRGGIMKSTDGGNTWTKVLSPRFSGTLSGTFEDAAADIEIGSNGDLYASFGIYTMGQIFRSTDNGANWINISPDGTGERIELAVAPSASSITGSTVIYAIAAGGSGETDVKWFKKSVNGGATWSDLPIPVLPDDPAKHFTRGQAFYDLILAVNPNDPNNVIVGGIDLHKTIDGGASWTPISQWQGLFGKPYVHSDHHAIVYKPGSISEVIFGNDGGVYYSPDAGSSLTPTFGMRNKNYNVTQFYSCAEKNMIGSSYFLAGAQDNGSQQFNSGGIGSTNEVSGGDGGYCFIDQDNPLYQLTSYTYNDVYRSINGGGSFSKEITDQSRGKFINPFDYDNTADILYSCGNVDELVRYSGISGTINTTYIAMSSLNGTKISNILANTHTPNRIFVGSDGGRVFRVDNANGSPTVTRIDNGTTPITTIGYVSCIDVGATDNELIVTYSNYGVISVWYSNDGGLNWISKDEISHGLPDMPVRWVLFNPNNTQQVLLATEIGVWSTNNITAANPAWEPSTANLANVRCDMLQHRTSDNLIIIATHGRGLFSTDVFAQPTSDFTADNVISYIGSTIQFNDASLQATSWSWDFGDGSTSTLKNPTHSYMTAGKFNVTLTINGTVTNTKSNFIHIIPTKNTPYLAADGGNFEVNPNDFVSQSPNGSLNIWERGTPSNALTTVSSGTNVWKTDLDADIFKGTYKCALLTPNFDMSNTGTYTLKFRKSMEYYYYNAPFAVQLQYSLDKGNTWTRLGSDNDPNGVNWYERGPSSANQINTDIFADQIGWLGSSNNQLTTYNVSFLAGNANVAFRFLLSVRDGYNQVGYDVDGFMIDDFEINLLDCSTTLPPFAESFESSSFPPDCWASYKGANGLGTVQSWTKNDTLFHSGASCASIKFENVTGGLAQDWLVSKKIGLLSASNTLSFWQRQGWSPDYSSSYSVRVSTTSQTDPTAFTTVATYGETTFSTAFTEKIIDLSAYNGQQVYIAFVLEQDDGDNWYIDDISITGTGTAPDITLPTVSSAVIQNAAPSSLVVIFSENVTATNANGFSVSGTAGSITGVSGSGTNTLTFSLSAAVVSGQTITLSYNATSGNVADMATIPNLLASLNNFPVTNNVLQIPPIVSTGSASSITTGEATVNGTVNANNASTAVTFEYGLTTSYGSSVAATPSPVTGSTNTTVSASISGLSSGTLYHFRVKAVNSGGTTNGSDATFTTSAAGSAPVADFSASATTITAGGSVNFTDLSSNSPTSWSWTFTGGTPSTSSVQNPTGIAYSTPGTYTVALTATNSFGSNTNTKTNYITVNVASALPTATANAATAITESDATLNGTVNANNASTTVTFEYGLTTSYGTSVNAVPGTVTGNTATSVSVTISGLTAGTLYHYRVKAVNSQGTTYSGDLTFITTAIACSPPTVQASNFTVNAGSNTATLNWVRGSGNNVLVVVRAGGQVNTDPDNGVTYNANPIFGSGDQIGTGNFVVYKGSGTSVVVTGLIPSTTYNVAIYEY